ncbi:TPA: hypothetical protein N0F65_007474 [Lagenidium giganteum]|uniref:STAS domain-containing protein n=1 Tax=Lagenidium giganteum TaxID=4803 RepID=A0AAV2ZL32_9STRA|nr:TPA: hypothetical protein N0F65_007474 [Lagenidium giganteum]
MEATALPLERGAVELLEAPLRRELRAQGSLSTQSLSPRSCTAQQQLIRRVSSYHGGLKTRLFKKTSGDGYGSHDMGDVEDVRLSLRPMRIGSAVSAPRGEGVWKRRVMEAMVDLTSGTIAFLLSSTLAVSCASVIVGHGTPLSEYIAHFIDMNFLGTAILSIVLAWQSGAPWTLGAIDVFVAPIMASMAQKITIHLRADMEYVVPTSVMMVALTSMLLGLVFFLMGVFRVTSIANYMPYPVIAGFLSGIGAELMKNGVHMASSDALSMLIFTIATQLLLIPALLFAAIARLGQHLHWPVAISFPCLLVLSMAGFHTLAWSFGMNMEDLKASGWVFPWSHEVINETPMWYAWAKIDFDAIQWRVLLYECFGYIISLVILGALKYSVATTSLSTLFARDICPDNEMRVIGLANIISGAFGCCGGCHYLSAMGIMKQFDAHEKVPALVCAFLLVLLWIQGIRLLQYVPKFVFGGLIMSVGLHFLEAYFLAPFHFLKPFEKAIVVGITLSFLVIGMLESVGLGIIISMVDLIYRIHEVGCIHHETTGTLTRSAVDRTPEQTAFLDAQGSSIFVLRLQGYLFFGTSVNVIERIETRVQSIDFPKLKYVIIDFGLVPDFDATALLNFRKASSLANIYLFDIYFCGLKKPIEAALKRNPASTRAHYVDGNVDVALERCENELLPSDLKYRVNGTIKEWKRMSQLELWEHYICFHQEEDVKTLRPLAAYLDVQVINQGSELCQTGLQHDTYFICFGFINVMADSEFSTDQNIPGVCLARSASQRLKTPSSRSHQTSRVMTEESQWTPFTTAQERLRKIGPGSIVTPDATSYFKHVATSDCVLLRLSSASMDKLEAKAPHTAVDVLKLVNGHLASRFLHSNKRVSQLSSLLYK